MPGLGAIMGNGHSGVHAYATDGNGNRLGHSYSMNRAILASPQAPPSTSFGSSTATTIARLSSSIDRTLSTLDALATSVGAMAAAESAGGPGAQAGVTAPSRATFSGQGKGLEKVAETAHTAGAGSSGSTSTTSTTSTTGTSGAGAASSPAPAATSPETTGLMAGTDQTVVDFGTMTINGVTNYLGSVQAPYMTSREAAEYVVGAINANDRNSATASLNDEGAIVLNSKDGSDIEIALGGATTDDAAQLVDIGFASGSFGSTVTASSSISSPLFAESFEATFRALTEAPSPTATTSSTTSGTSGAGETGGITTDGGTFMTGRPTPKGWLRKGA